MISDEFSSLFLLKLKSNSVLLFWSRVHCATKCRWNTSSFQRKLYVEQVIFSIFLLFKNLIIIEKTFSDAVSRRIKLYIHFSNMDLFYLHNYFCTFIFWFIKNLYDILILTDFCSILWQVVVFFCMVEIVILIIHSMFLESILAILFLQSCISP